MSVRYEGLMRTAFARLGTAAPEQFSPIADRKTSP